MMIEQFVSASLKRRWLVLIVFLLLGVFGYMSWQELAIEAYPDIADTTAQVVTQYAGHAAEEVEEQVTIPIERELNGTPGLLIMRSRSTFGLSLITLVFQDGIDDYFARQRIRERLTNVALPPGAEASLDPLTSPIGEIYRYTLESPSRSQRELRELQRWVVAPTLRQVTGVADITNFGGETTQFQLILDPARLIQYGVSLKDVTEAITNNNSNAGGSILVRGDQGFVVRGIGLIRNLEDLGNIVISEQHGTPVFLRSLGTLQLGALQRNGILGKDGNPDGVSGIVLLLRGENPSRVLDGLHERVAALNGGLLPADVKVVPYLDRTDLVRTTLNTVSHTMVEGIGLVIIVLILFLGSPRSALIVATVIPLSLLIAFILMRMTSIPANLLSLGAIDFGIIVDGAIVVMESILRRREERPQDEMTEGDAISATSLVARPIFFAKIIIPIVLVLIFILLYGAFGVAVQNGVILVSGLHELRKTGMPLAEAVAVGATQRLRAVVLTATVAALGMLPAALAHGIGSDVQRPLATVVVGGLVSATLLTLFVLPALYDVIEMSNSSELPPVDSNSNVDTFAGLVESEESPPIPAAPLSEVAP
jgi:cobalt-zinc-cadmium resistance protein CzcA